MNNDDYSSGFVDTADAGTAQPEATFSGMEEIYVSEWGYNRLFKANLFGKKVIVKAVKPQYLQTIFCRQLLYKEFAIGYQLEHPHICATYGREELPGLGACIVMEYIDGITLREYMKQGKLTPGKAKKIISELCDALQYMHSKQIVHRDLKPENIMIAHNGDNVKLIDFGLSDSDDSLLLKIPAGTRHYMAPEARQKGYVPTLLADIYSLGIILGEMGEALKDKRMKEVADRCTCRAPEQRIASAAAVEQALTRPSRLRALGIATLTAGVLLIGGYGLYTLRSESQPPVYPTYGNVPETPACRELVMRKAAERHGQPFTAQDSLELMRAIETVLQETYPTPEMQATPSYRRQMAHWGEVIRGTGNVNAD